MFFIKSVWRVRKHETQSYRESCVFHFSHFDLYINIYIYIISKSLIWHFLVDTMSNLDLPSRGLPVIITEESVCMVLSITGNSLVCIAAYRNPNLRSTTNLYIIALAVSDLLCAAIEMPSTFTTLIIGRWDFGDILCQIQGSRLVYLPIMLPRQPLVRQRLTVTWKLWRRTTIIRFSRPADLRYGWVACGFPLLFTCWLSESQIGSE